MKKYITVTFITLICIFICFAPGITIGNGSYSTNLSIFDTMTSGNPGMTTVFVFYLIALIIPFLVSIVYLVIGENKNLIIFAKITSVLNIVLFLLNGILTFCIVPLTTGINVGVNIGTGSIFFGIFNIILAIASCIAIADIIKQEEKLTPKQAVETTKIASEPQPNNKDGTKFIDNSKEESNSSINEMDKISMIREYKKLLDEGLISEEQFKNKRDELLK